MEVEVAVAPTLIGLPPSNVTRDASGWEGHLLAKSTISTACEGSEERNCVWRLHTILLIFGRFVLSGWRLFVSHCMSA